MTAPVRRALPPPPRRREWGLAGVAAGLALAAAEGLFAWVEGQAPPARLALAWAAATTLCAAAPAALVGLAAAPRRAPYSALVGTAAGGLLAAPAVGSGLALAVTPDRPVLALLGPLAGLVLASLAGAVLARALVRLEQLSVLPVPALPLWALLAVLVAAAERRLGGGARGMDVAGLLAAAVVLAALATAGIAAAHAGSARLRVGPLGRAVALGLVANAAAVAGPSLGPWLWNEPTRWLSGPPSPSLLGVILPETLGDDAERLPTVAVYAANGARWLVATRHAPPAADPASGTVAAHALLRLPNGDALPARLAGSGVRVGAVLADPARRAPPGVVDVRVRVLARDLLETELTRRAGGALLATLAGERLAGGPADAVRAATAEASRWLLAWRAAPTAVPFALVVDLGGAASAGADPDAVDAALAGLLELADEIGALPSAGVWLALPPRRDGTLGVVLQPPRAATAPPPPSGTRPAPASTVAAVLLRWSELSLGAPAPELARTPR